MVHCVYNSLADVPNAVNTGTLESGWYVFFQVCNLQINGILTHPIENFSSVSVTLVLYTNGYQSAFQLFTYVISQKNQLNVMSLWLKTSTIWCSTQSDKSPSLPSVNVVELNPICHLGASLPGHCLGVFKLIDNVLPEWCHEQFLALQKGGFFAKRFHWRFISWKIPLPA